MVNMRIVDLQLNLDEVLLKEHETVEELISKIEKIINSNYPVQYEILNEEYYD